MTTRLARTRPVGLLDRILDWIEGHAVAEPAKDAPETDRDRRDFLLGMMEDHPHAFTSEADVQCMMHLYPGRF
jgi:hypothetical protein